MLTDLEKDALEKWYSQEKVLSLTKRFIDAKEWLELEEHLQMRCLFPISHHSELPDYMLTDEGKPLFPTNLNPKADLEKWQDAIEIGWEVVGKLCSLSRDDVHREIASEQQADWADFIARFEARKRKKEEEA